jgi:hypothetical protein
MEYNAGDHSCVQVVVKSVTGNIVICSLVTEKGATEILMKRGDYDRLLEQGFFNKENTDGEAGLISASEKYEVPNPYVIE